MEQIVRKHVLFTNLSGYIIWLNKKKCYFVTTYRAMFRTVHVLLKIPTKIQTIVCVCRACWVSCAAPEARTTSSHGAAQLCFYEFTQTERETRVRENSSTKAVLVTIAPVLILRERE